MITFVHHMDKSMRFVSLIASATLLLAASASAQTLNFKSVTAPAVLYDTPSEKGRKVFVAPSGMPVEIILVYGEWSKVRDAVGSLNWIRSNALSDKRNVVVKTNNAQIHSTASQSSPVLFTADQNVLLQLDNTGDKTWLKVTHESGKTGYIRSADVWGS